jgi:hypothetical protein
MQRKKIYLVNSTRTQSVLNQTLTTYAYGLEQDVRSVIADFIAPPTPVGVSLGQFKSFSDKNAFVVYDTKRAFGGPAQRVAFAASDSTFNCKPQALEVAIDDAERSADGDDLNLEQARIRTLVVNATVAHENAVMTAAKAGVSAEGGKGNWSSANVDPIAELDEQIEALAIATGMMPNRLLLGIGALRILRNNPKVVAKFPGAAAVGVSTSQIAALLLNPAIEIQVGVLSKDTTKLGQTKSAANIVGSECFIFLASQNPTQFDPSFMKTFQVRGGSVTAVRQYRDENVRSDIYAVDWSEDIKVTGTACVKRVSVS